MTQQADLRHSFFSCDLRSPLISAVILILSGGATFAWGQEDNPTRESSPQATPREMTESNTAPSIVSDPQAGTPLSAALTRIAAKSMEKLRPDVRNGLIRVAVLTAQGSGEDRPSREALAIALSSRVAEQSNVFVADVEQTIEALRRFDRLSLPLTLERSISLGQHLGVRYVLMTDVIQSGDDQLKLSARLVSVKQRGFVYDETLSVSRSGYDRLRAQLVFDERKLSATWRSAVLPGWGQLYQGRKGDAIAYMGLTAALITGALWAQGQGSTAEERYQENIPDTVQYRFEANQHYARARLMWGALGVTWISATLSAYLQGEDRSRVQFNLDPSQGGVHLSGTF